MPQIEHRENSQFICKSNRNYFLHSSLIVFNSTQDGGNGDDDDDDGQDNEDDNDNDDDGKDNEEQLPADTAEVVLPPPLSFCPPLLLKNPIIQTPPQHVSISRAIGVHLGVSQIQCPWSINV